MVVALLAVVTCKRPSIPNESKLCVMFIAVENGIWLACTLARRLAPHYLKRSDEFSSYDRSLLGVFVKSHAASIVLHKTCE